MQERLENGLVVRVTGGEIWVRVGTETLACSLRGRFRARVPVVAGDRVSVLRDATGGARLETMQPRTSWLSRYVERGATERVVVANIERLFVVVAATDPPVRAGFIDRVLASAEWGHIPASIIFNKIDLAGSGQFDALRTAYEPAGYELVETSAIRGQGIDRIAERIGHGVYAFVGESGVGKSSLLNRLDPNLDLVVDDVTERSGRGRHTTTNSQLFPFREGFLADTPGMQTFTFPGSDIDALAACFREIAAVDGECRYHPCSHSHEPGCAVKVALEAGQIPPSRYESYLEILVGIRERARHRQW